MVTIEQKLLLFSKLLNQSMDKKFEEELKELDNQYREKIQKNKEAVDNEVRSIEEKAKIGTETKYAQSLSKSRVNFKKEVMSLNEKYYKVFMSKFKEKLNSFVKSDEYRMYLSNILTKLNDELFSSEKILSVVIYATEYDFDKYGEFIRHEIVEKHSDLNIVFKKTDTIIGGLIVENTENNFKVDMTIDAVLEDNKGYIMQTLFQSLEAGAYNG